MKSFSQFLQESYLNEEPAGRPARRRTGGPTPEEVKAQIDAKDAEKAARKAQRGPTGAAADSTKQFKPKSTTVASPALPSSPRGGPLATRGTNLQAPPDSMMKGAYDAARKQASTSKPSSGGKTPGLPPSGAKPPTGGKPPITPPSGTSSAAKETQKAATKTAGKGILRTIGRVAGPAAAALDVADERSKGSGWARSLAKGAVVAAGGALGGAAGSVAGPVGTVAGATGGSMAASKAFDVAAGANAKERKAMATANRQKQAGTAVKGIGGKTTFDTKKNTITTGSGAQRKTVGLAKTGVVQRGGQSVAGNLAYKGGKAVYKAGPSAQSLAKTSSNPLERVGRSLFAGAYKKSDAANAAKKLATARSSDAARNKALGVKSKPAG